MADAELLELLTECLGIGPDRLTVETRISDVPEWDSVAWLTVISAVDAKIGFLMEPSQIAGLRTIKDLARYIGG